MQKFAVIASAVIVAIAVAAGCRGSVDRHYDDPLGGDGGSSSSGIVGGKEHTDASDDGSVLATAPAHITGTVVGLIGTGLVLQNNGADDLPVKAPGAFTFTTLVAPGQPYKVTVANQPTAPSQTCTVTGGEGTAQGADVLGVQVSCVTATYPVGGTVVGLNPGATVTLVNNGGNDQVVSTNSAFTFPPVPSGATFSVTVKGSTGATCKVSGGTGTVVTAGVDSVVVNCDPSSYTVGGSVTGVAGTLVIQNNGGNDRTLSAEGSFAFSIPITSGTNYAVTVKTQPAFPPKTQVCTVTKGSGQMGTADVTDVAINCTTTKYTVGGNVSGLTGTGLKLQNNGGDDKTIGPSVGVGSPFTFATSIASGSSYNVTIVTQPSGQICSVSNPTGTVTSGNINGIAVTCSVPIPLSEKFDGVEDPAIPAGWTTMALTNPTATLANAWTTVSDPGDHNTAPNAAFIENIPMSRDVALISPTFSVASSTAKLSFWNKWQTEDAWDGGVLEIAIAGGAWTDILAAGGSFNTGGYTKALMADGGNTLGGRQAWNGRGLATTSVNLPAACAGKNVQLRWRFGSDADASDNGWWIDDVVVTN